MESRAFTWQGKTVTRAEWYGLEAQRLLSGCGVNPPWNVIDALFVKRLSVAEASATTGANSESLHEYQAVVVREAIRETEEGKRELKGSAVAILALPDCGGDIPPIERVTE